MKIKLTLRRPGAEAVDVIATLDRGATIGGLAAHLWRADPAASAVQQPAGHGAPTLCLAGAARVPLDPETKVVDSGLRSGMTVELTPAPAAFAAPPGEPVAVVTVTAGPDRGAEFVLRARNETIGRDRGCAVRLSDPLVSRRHARIAVGALVEITDLGSANGMFASGAATTRAVLRPGESIRVGDTELSIRVTPTAGPGPAAAAEGYVRSPRLDPRYAGETFEAPEPPKPPQGSRFPIVALLASVIMGAALFLVTRSTVTLVFIAISPLMMLAYTAETMWSSRSAHKKAVAQFGKDLDELQDEAARAAAAEVTARGREHPPLAECVDAARRRGPLLWTRRPDDPGFGEFRLGLAAQPSRSQIVLPANRQNLPRDLMEKLKAVTARFATVEPVPVIATPAVEGAIGLAGPRDTLIPAAIALTFQTAALHSPAEMVMTAFISHEQTPVWQWLKWLPHTTSAHSPISQRHLASTAEGSLVLISELEDLLAARQTEEQPPLPAVLVLVDDDAPVERSRLVTLAEHGWRHGIHVLWLAAAASRLPAACRTFVTLATEPGPHTVGFAHTGHQTTSLAVETLDPSHAMELARGMSALIDVGARTDDGSELPSAVSLLAVGDEPLAATTETILERWTLNRSVITGPYAPATPVKRAGTLRAVLGRTALGPHVLDLREDGPHALVGGTTGSGKSELLQAWLLAMAAAHSPQRLTFMLIDYKGGSAFKELALLPHTVGNFNDLDPHLVRRALLSLSAELRSREELFAQHGVKDLVEMEKKGLTDAPPSLVIVVDEFAALVQELPEFIDGVINVAQRGRSLGVHLILATQRPESVIKQDLRANTNLRVALRTADEDDSTNILGSPQAAFFDSAIPGRAVSKTGPGRLVQFQTGYVGGWTSQKPPSPRIEVQELKFGDPVPWEAPDTDDEAATDLGPTDIQRMVAAISLAKTAAQLPRADQPWLNALAHHYDLSDLDVVRTARRDNELVFGIQDRPKQQDQPSVAYRPDEGNLVVFGTGGSGKTTLLRAIAIAAGFAVRGGPCHIYGIDFGNGGLSMLEELPHVGSIVAGSDTERITRLLTMLTQLTADRGERFARAGAATLSEYRHTPGRADEPRILLLLDGLAAFRQAFEVDRARLFDTFCQLASEGRRFGVHMLVTADQLHTLPSQLASAMPTRIVLRMADIADYQSMGVPADVLKPSSPPGRGLLQGIELQVAVLGPESDAGSQLAAYKDFGATLTHGGISPAPPVPRMPERILLSNLPPAIDGHPVLGMDASTLQPRAFSPEGTFLITGPPQSGRSSALRAVAVALRRWTPGIELHLFSAARRSAVADPALWTAQSLGQDNAKERAELLTRQLEKGSAPPMAVFVEGIAELGASPAELAITDLVKLCLAEGVFVVAEGETGTLSGYGTLLAAVKHSRYGLAFAPDPADGDRVFRTPFPHRLNRAEFPPGRALFVHAGRTPAVGVGWVEEGA
jgi:DNA segregation ATPase FtsK/SpoIIIE, S-DNA-T family